MSKIITNGGKSGHIDGTKRNDVIEGRGGNDRIGGHRGDDIIDGGRGNDNLHGGQGHDTLTGGAGRDQFIFREFSDKDSDHITDFTHKVDKIALDGSVFTALRGSHVKATEFVLGVAALDKNDHVIYDSATGSLYYDDDGTGKHAQHLIATLDNHAHTSLTLSDILVL